LAKVDETHNCLLLSPTARQGFDMFAWCLRATETPNRYEIKVHHPNHAGASHVDRHVTFEDRNTEFTSSDDNASVPNSGTTPQPLQPSQKPPGVEPPNPRLLRLHAALTSVLHLSGAASVFGALYRTRSAASDSVLPDTNGPAFWTSVVSYDGPEVTLQADMSYSIALSLSSL
ncbi:uncharacterized protein B0H18DRAFT_880561, partial [Fomitopsis serialis]|uniref:uncharacterized protein n=1 Tax=Fomitopsis serialis TaxID=139415 RepID=UPI002008B1DB